jgi:hypothetical protein
MLKDLLKNPKHRNKVVAIVCALVVAVIGGIIKGCAE